MRYLLDTNVVSEPFKRVPEPRVLRWLDERSPLDLCLSVLTLGELTLGFELASSTTRRDALRTWVSHDLPRRFTGRILPVDEVVAREWGRLSAEGRLAGRELPAVDGMLLATARVHELTFVTRNLRDCAERGVEVFNPWS